MAQLQVTWFSKPGGRNNPHSRISRLGGPGWEASEDEVIRAIQGNYNSYYVSRGGYRVAVIIGTHNDGHRYLKTVPDGTPIDNLLSLEERPA